MRRALKLSLVVLAVTAGGAFACGVPKQVHCKFVSDVGSAASNYAAAAGAASNPGWQAEAKELKKTVDSEKNSYCTP